jgi:tetratricopeptide (TPR) repeat protein
VADRVFQRDLFEGRLQRGVDDFWDGAPALAEASRRLVALARGPSHEVAGALTAAGAAELLQGRRERADELGRRALTLGPQLAGPPALLGYASLERGDARGAAAWARAALELQPGQPAALSVRARALEAMGKRLEAQGAWREALDGAPDLSTGRLALARLLILDGQPQAARPLLEPLVKDDPGAAEAVGVLRDLGRTRAASR